MKKILLSAAVVLGFIFYSFKQNAPVDTTANGVSQTQTGNQTSQAPAAAGSGNAPASQTAQQTQNGGASAPNKPANNPAPTASKPASTGQYKDGSYTGSAVDAYYGNVQVQVTIAGGKITDVQFLQYPNDRQTSLQISQQAMPALKQETIASQSAQVDIVSGATQFSEGYIQSLTSALTQAKS